MFQDRDQIGSMISNHVIGLGSTETQIKCKWKGEYFDRLMYFYYTLSPSLPPFSLPPFPLSPSLLPSFFNLLIMTYVALRRKIKERNYRGLFEEGTNVILSSNMKKCIFENRIQEFFCSSDWFLASFKIDHLITSIEIISGAISVLVTCLTKDSSTIFTSPFTMSSIQNLKKKIEMA